MNSSQEFTTIMIIIFAYGIAYGMMSERDFGFKDWIDPLYFSFTTMTTVGYGDFTPKTRRAKMLVMSQQVLVLAGELFLICKYFGFRKCV